MTTYFVFQNSLFNNPFALGSLSNNSASDKDRHSNLDSIANLPHTILRLILLLIFNIDFYLLFSF